MDRAEITKLVERAEKLLQKGKTADALDAYLHVLASDPRNSAIRQMSADLCLSLQRVPEAVKLLGELFDQQIQAGDATLASLTYKKLSRFANPSWRQKVQFGQLLENSNRKLAVETYETALDEVLKEGTKSDCAVVLKRIVTFEPSERNLLRLGELSSEVKDNRTAASAFLKLGQLAEASGGESAKWFERAYTEDSSDSQIALAYGKSLLEQGEVGASIFVLEPQLTAAPPSPELRETYAKALLAANRLNEAEPLVWQMFEQNPSRHHDVAKLIGLLIDAQQDAEAVALARKLEQVQRRRGERKNFAAMMQDIAAEHRASPEVLEYMSELFNASNRETDYSQTLLKLFDLYFGMGNFAKAAECLDRAAEVDAYEPGHLKRLESLRGKVEEKRYKVISSRFTGLGQSVPETRRTHEPTIGASALQDLVLQVEILVQYGMQSKAIERLQYIQELFPHEAERSEDLHRLYLAVGMTPPRPPEQPAPAPVTQAAAEARQAASADAPDVSSLTRVAEITRLLYRQGNPDAVLSTAVNEIGAQWKVSRCVAAMRKPGSPPTAVKEFCAEAIPMGEGWALSKLVTVAQDLAIANGPLAITDIGVSTELQGSREALAVLGVTSLIAIPLSEGPHQLGVLMLMQNKARRWHANELVVLKTVSDQVVMSMNNAGLRRLVKNLSVTDEESGLLKRASYLDMLLGESKRCVQQSNSLSVVLMQFGKPNPMLKEFGETQIDATIHQIGQICTTNIGQNDLAFRYETTTVALVFAGAGEAEALATVEKLRKLLEQVPLPGREEAIPFHAGIAEAIVRPSFDPVDIVTELINRAERALDESMAKETGTVIALGATLVSAAVA